MPSLDEERAVVARLQRGDRAAFAQLYAWFGLRLYRILVGRIVPPEAAEDVLKDTFRTAMEKIGQFTDHGRSIFHWLRRIAVNKAIDVQRKRQRERAGNDRLFVQPEVITSQAPATPDRGLQMEDTRSEVELSLSRLNPRYAQVLRLRLIEERSREEIAALLDISVGNLDVLFHRACKAFRKEYPP